MLICSIRQCSADYYHLFDASDLYAHGPAVKIGAKGVALPPKSVAVASACGYDSDGDPIDDTPQDCPTCGPALPATQFIVCDDCDKSYVAAALSLSCLWCVTARCSMFDQYQVPHEVPGAADENRSCG